MLATAGRPIVRVAALLLVAGCGAAPKGTTAGGLAASPVEPTVAPGDAPAEPRSELGEAPARDASRETRGGSLVGLQGVGASEEPCTGAPADADPEEGYVRCAERFLERFERDPSAPAAASYLYDAGKWFVAGKSFGAAINAFTLLTVRYPNTTLAAHALFGLGESFGAVADYRRAAEAYEQFGRMYSGERDALEALSRATFFWKALGDDAKAVEDTRFFIKTFGRARPDAAADAAFGLTAIYEKERDRLDPRRDRRAYEAASARAVAHLKQYLAQHGKIGGRAREVVAYAKIGAALWAQSCPVATVDGICAQAGARSEASERSPRQPTQCGPGSVKLTLITRDARLVKEAAEAFAAARTAFQAGRGAAEQDAAARYHYGQATFYQAEAAFEAYLKLQFPDALDFDPKKRSSLSKRRFEEWFSAKLRLGSAATASFGAVLEVKDAASTIAAVARVGQIPQLFSDALLTAEIPRDVRTGPFADEKVDAFCGTLSAVVEPLEAKAVEAYGACTTKAAELGWSSDWSRLCERELARLEPEKFPLASELRAPATQLTRITDLERPAVRRDRPSEPHAGHE
ncbi:MAG: hypothetical protein R3B48_19155 [Kofleriaceae bacterium]